MYPESLTDGEDWTHSHYGHFRHMLRVHMISKRIFLCFLIIAMHTFPSYASSSHELKNTLFVSLQTHTWYISVICFIFTLFVQFILVFFNVMIIFHVRFFLF